MNSLPEKLRGLQRDIFVDEKGRIYELPEMALIQTFNPLLNGTKRGRFHPLCCFAKSAYYQTGYSKHEIYHIYANLNKTTAIEWTKLRIDYEYFLFVKYGQNRQDIHKQAVNDLLTISCETWDRTEKSSALLFETKSSK